MFRNPKSVTRVQLRKVQSIEQNSKRKIQPACASTGEHEPGTKLGRYDTSKVREKKRPVLGAGKIPDQCQARENLRSEVRKKGD